MFELRDNYSRKNRSSPDEGTGMAQLLADRVAHLSVSDGDGDVNNATSPARVSIRPPSQPQHIIYSTIQMKTRIGHTDNHHSNNRGSRNWFGNIYDKAVHWFKKRGRMRQRNMSQESRMKGSLYNLIKSILPAAEDTEIVVKSNSTAPTKHATAASTGTRRSQSAQQLPSGKAAATAKDAWKGDAIKIIKGDYARLQSTDFPKTYHAVSIIGQGSFGFVLRAKCLDDTSRHVAVKFIHRASINAASWMFNGALGLVPSEVHYTQSLRHPNIITYVDFFDDGKYCYLVTELFGTSWAPESNHLVNPQRNPGLKLRKSADKPLLQSIAGMEEAPCDLFECIEAHNYLPEATIHKIFCQLLSVVNYLASCGVVHRDLKDENVVVDADYRIKIVDFGSATAMPRSLTASEDDNEGWFDKFNGTLAFAPPEVIRGMRYKGTEAEIWTLGILLYTMAFRQSPFPDSQAILHGRLDFPYEENESAGILDLIRKLLAKNPAQRIKLKELPRHPWVLDGPPKPKAEHLSMPRLEV